ncbi:acyl transferase 1-like [Triticum aestivum]|uniref:acyl transferase 1-like n=1 Tax=Triticum aestivum TaxID=4565 RepID=UPI001D0272B2|nr:acyl transferase 1-like [Triticum aestivum]
MVTFTARRREPELVRPARPTPVETKALSDLDDQWSLRFYESIVGFFRSPPGESTTPGKVAKGIKAAVAGALVYYYPMAGRLRKLPDGNKLVVDCTGEGVMFVEATADVRLEDLGQPLVPPYPCVEEFLGDAGNTRDVIGKPLLFLQLSREKGEKVKSLLGNSDYGSFSSGKSFKKVTQLKCGGFVIGLHMCHCIADGFGILQFIKFIADLACGELIPTTLPVWKRDIFTARIPPSVSHVYSAYKPFLLGLDCRGNDVMLSTPPETMEVQYLFFGPKEIEILKSHVPGHLSKSTTTFELITAVMWRCRTLALGYESNQKVRVMFTLNARGRSINGESVAVPHGYYGNAHLSPVVEVTVDELSTKPLAHILELMRKVKMDTTKACVKSMVDLMALWREWSPFCMDRTYEVSDTKWVGGNTLQFGKAELVAAGTPHAGDFTSKLISYHTKCKNQDGEDSTVVSILLPKLAMEKFTKEMAIWLKK